MNPSVPNKLKPGILILVAVFLFSANSFSQTAPAPVAVPELVFANPVLVSGQPNQDSAVYRFSNVITGVDATITILGRSGSIVVLDTIDLAYTPGIGFEKAWQPQLGIHGNVPANTNWWMRFQINFWYAGTAVKYKVPHFVATALDVDGDGLTIAEFVQMDKVDSIKYSPVTKLTAGVPLQFPFYGDGNENGSNNGSSVYNIQPNATVDNAAGIDTSATANMATAYWTNTDQITITYGANSGGYISNAGQRLNSMWFKTFDMAPKATQVLSILPVTITSFSAAYQNSAVQLNWSSANAVNFSRFVVQRSTDGKMYKDCGVVFNNAEANENANYSFTDKNVSSSTGVVCYRLRMVDVSEEFTYSGVRMVRLSQEAPQNLVLNTYPNPVVNELRVTIPNSWQGKKVSLQLFNAGGIQMQTIQLENASQTEVLNMQSLSKALYIVKATCGNQAAQQRVIKN